MLRELLPCKRPPAAPKNGIFWVGIAARGKRRRKRANTEEGRRRKSEAEEAALRTGGGLDALESAPDALFPGDGGENRRNQGKGGWESPPRG